ncbi:MAG TPA: DNA-binding protein [Myxococcales bacterium]|nr:DNA-binding protein [Myxococcales bacterium]HAN32746.1 DNA-binding protein [Myxococcales bacterium]
MTKRTRSKTIAMRPMSAAEIEEGKTLVEFMDIRRPQTRLDCQNGPRPCPFVSCQHHLYLDVNPNTGSIKINFPNMEVWEMPHTCALDVAERGGITLEEVGSIMNLTRERIRQVEVSGLEKLQSEPFAENIQELRSLDA